MSGRSSYHFTPRKPGCPGDSRSVFYKRSEGSKEEDDSERIVLCERSHSSRHTSRLNSLVLSGLAVCRLPSVGLTSVGTSDVLDSGPRDGCL